MIEQVENQELERRVEEIPPFNYNQFVEDWKANPNSPVLDIVSRHYRKPEPTLTPEQQQKARFGAALSDSLASIAEMVAHGRGAYIRDREPNRSQQTTNDRLQQIQDRYLNESLRYNTALKDAETQDFNNFLRAELQGRGERREDLRWNQQRADREQQRDDRLAEQERQQAHRDQQQDNWERNFAETQRRNRELEGHRQNVNARQWAGHNFRVSGGSGTGANRTRTIESMDGNWRVELPEQEAFARAAQLYSRLIGILDADGNPRVDERTARNWLGLPQGVQLNNAQMLAVVQQNAHLLMNDEMNFLRNGTTGLQQQTTTNTSGGFGGWFD